MDEYVTKLLFDNQDIKFKEFNDKIVNTNTKTIGVRTPIVKTIAKSLSKDNYNECLNEVKDDYYEKTLLKGFIISKIKDDNIFIDKLDDYIDKIDNWASCDMVCSASKKLSKHYKYAIYNVSSKDPWGVRFGYVMLLDYFTLDKYLNNIFDILDNDKNNNYYVMMSKAWLISNCFIKFPEETLKYLKVTNVDKETYNKAISKICDSYRVLLNIKTLSKR